MRIQGYVRLRDRQSGECTVRVMDAEISDQLSQELIKKVLQEVLPKDLEQNQEPLYIGALRIHRESLNLE